MDQFYSSLAVTRTTASSPNDVTAPGDHQAIKEGIPVFANSLDGGWVGKISTTIILLFGTFGNVMTVIILRRLRSGWSAMNVYLTALALSDTAMLYCVALPTWARKVLDYDVYASHVVICKLAMWGMSLASISSAWLLVALTAQRAASVVWPHRVNIICTRHKSVVISVTIMVGCGLLQSHMLYGGSLVKINNSTTETCTFSSTAYQEFYTRVWIRVNTFLYSVLPCVCLIVSNVIIGWKLTGAMKEAKDKFSARSENQKDRRQRKASSVTVTIITVSVAFVVITVPFMVCSSVLYASTPSEIHLFLYDVLFVIGLFNFAWNFYLYCLTGSKFREEFKKIMFGCCGPVMSAVGSAYVTEGNNQVSEIGNRVAKEHGPESNDDF